MWVLNIEVPIRGSDGLRKSIVYQIGIVHNNSHGYRNVKIFWMYELFLIQKEQVIVCCS